MKNAGAILCLFLCLIFGVVSLTVDAHKAGGEEKLFLPIALNYYPFLIADFETGAECIQGVNNLGGTMGAAFEPPDFLLETYEFEPVWQSCAVKLTFENREMWSAFWLKLGPTDLENVSTLQFRMFIEEIINGNDTSLLRVELKRGCEESECQEAWFQEVPVSVGQHQQIEIQLSNFVSLADGGNPPPFTQIEELVFSFQKVSFGDQGTVFLDNILFVP